MDKQKAFNVGIILLMIAGFTINAVYDPTTGEPLELTHYCESIGIRMYCARTTAQYCYPVLGTRRNSKKCSEGWELIPEPIPSQLISLGGGSRFVCDKVGCTATS